jgi:hypothetical protein
MVNKQIGEGSVLQLATSRETSGSKPKNIASVPNATTASAISNIAFAIMMMNVIVSLLRAPACARSPFLSSTRVFLLLR